MTSADDPTTCEACHVGWGEVCNDVWCEPCGQPPWRCICLSPAQVAAYVTGGDNARWLKRPGKSEAE